MEGIDGEVIVVDNASVDRTPQLVKLHFPEVILISNSDNKGFSKANNQGISIGRGEYILLLNPDTIVSENTFSTCIDFMEGHSDAGAVGVKMIDGSGKFLPESKRGLPTLRASFMKMTGLYRLAPRSATWNSYYEGQVNENETAKIHVLTGAFMFMRKSALHKAGVLDESFFMYGEDIDLSYRIAKAGYAIYYLPATHLVHKLKADRPLYNTRPIARQRRQPLQLLVPLKYESGDQTEVISDRHWVLLPGNRKVAMAKQNLVRSQTG